MDFMPLIFSLLFFAAGIIFIAIGMYALSIDQKARLNQVFFFMSLALFIWSFGYSVSNNVTTEEASLFWHRFSALGFGSVYSFLLHYFLLFTEKQKLLKKPVTYLGIYSPAIVAIYVYSLSADLARSQFQLTKTPFGWTTVLQNNGWDIFYYIYYIVYVLLSIVLLWNWGKRASSEGIKRQYRLILYSFLIALLLATVTDVIMNSLLMYNKPQIAPIIILIPISTMYYSMKKYRIFVPHALNEDEIILNTTHLARVINYISITFIAGGFLHFISQYLMNDNLNLSSVIFISSLLILTGLLIQIINRMNMSKNTKELIETILISVLIPILTIKYVEFASITIWAFPFLFIIISLVFNRRLMLLGLSLTTIFTQILVWVMMPSTTVVVNQADHIGRLGLFAIGIWLAFYVNNVYILRLKENADQIEIQKLIADISSDFVSMEGYNLSHKTDRMLRLCGEFFGSDCASFVVIDHEHDRLVYRNEWCNDTTTSIKQKVNEFPLDRFPWWMNQIMNQRVVEVTNLERLPEEAKEEQVFLNQVGVKSLVTIPIVSNGVVHGFLGFEFIHQVKKIKVDHMDALKIFSNLLADALQKTKTEYEINQLAYYDYLTKLPNRTLFQEQVKQSIYLSNRTGNLVGVIFIDLDSFKNVNDTMGHEGGDDLLIQVAQRLVKCVGKKDTVSRIGGDEFLILINQLEKDSDILQIAENMIEQFNNPFIFNGQKFFITASAGISIYPQDGVDSQSLIKSADIAMYYAKEKGKNQFVMCSDTMKEEAHHKMRLINDLYRAMDRQELVLYYQPQVSLETQEIIGLEALIRWNHPEMGMISPGVFIPLAEQTGLINSIGEWVLKTACKQNKVWQDKGLPPIRMAVNLSINQFQNPNFVGLVDRVLKETGLKADYLELEITETIAIQESEYVIVALNRLKEIGVSISIDDFGTEYSSLSRLTSLPVDRIKIDTQFIRGISENAKDIIVTDIIINLAKSLGLRVIAEGVETKAQVDFLSQRKCDEVQGFYYYKPMPIEETEIALQNSMT